MVAGFEPPTSGKILLDGTDVGNRPPHRRNVNTVFQSYALFPFLTVAENVAFGLKYKSVPKSEMNTRVAETLELVELSGYEKRRPNQLSGGQQQRVALARALVLRPAVLLLDEPLGALDAKIRKQLRLELKALQEEVGITFVFVTHDQEEALSMSDRVAVMNAGQIEQIGTPAEVYESPATVFVADFLGVSNLMDGEAVGWGTGECTVAVGDFKLRAACGEVGTRGRRQDRRAARAGAPAPARVRAPTTACPGWSSGPSTSAPRLQVMVRLVTGAALQVSVANSGGAQEHGQGTPVDVHVPPDALRVLARRSRQRSRRRWTRRPAEPAHATTLDSPA